MMTSRLAAAAGILIAVSLAITGCSPSGPAGSTTPSARPAGSTTSSARPSGSAVPAGSTTSSADPSGQSGATDGRSGRSAPSGELVVFAAASLQEVVEGLAADLETEYPDVEVTVSFGGSADLVSQVSAGAPADVLMTADESTMARAADGGSLAGPPVVVAENSPALVVPVGNPARITGLDASLEGADLVVCAPQVPCGAAAAELAENAGVALTPVSEELSVTDVLGKVTSGQADAGVVYATDTRRAGGSVEVVDVPGAADVVNRYPAAVVAGGDEGLATLWIDTLTGEPGRDRLTAAGFGVP